MPNSYHSNLLDIEEEGSKVPFTKTKKTKRVQLTPSKQNKEKNNRLFNIKILQLISMASVWFPRSKISERNGKKNVKTNKNMKKNNRKKKIDGNVAVHSMEDIELPLRSYGYAPCEDVRGCNGK